MTTPDPTVTLGRITAALDEHQDDAMYALSQVSIILSESGWPTVDPVDTMDPPDARVMLIWMALAGRYWNDHDVEALRAVLEVEDDALDLRLIEGLIDARDTP